MSEQEPPLPGVCYAEPGSEEFHAWRRQCELWIAHGKMECEARNKRSREQAERSRCAAGILTAILFPIVVALAITSVLIRWL